MPFVLDLVSGLSILLFAAAVLVWATGVMEIGAGFRGAVHRLVSNISRNPWRTAPMLAIAALVGALDCYVNYWFRQSEKNIVASVAFVVIVLVAIPVAALINLVRGGSSFLMWVVIAVAVAFAVMTVLGEIKRLKAFSSVLALGVFATAFLFVPGYVFYSLTDRMLNMPVGHAAIGSLLIVPCLYLVCQGAVILLIQRVGRHKTGTPPSDPSLDQIGLWERQIGYFAGALPIAYLLTFAGFLAGQFSIAMLPLSMNWPTMLASLVTVGLSLSLTAQWLGGAVEGGRAARFGLALAGSLGITVILSMALAEISRVPILVVGKDPNDGSIKNLFDSLIGLSVDGSAYILGPNFWIGHLPFAPLVIVILTMALGLLLGLVVRTGLFAKSEPGGTIASTRQGALSLAILGAICLLGRGLL